MKGVYHDSFGRRDVMQPMQHSGAGERPSFAICFALRVGGDNDSGLPCDPSECLAKHQFGAANGWS